MRKIVCRLLACAVASLGLAGAATAEEVTEVAIPDSPPTSEAYSDSAEFGWFVGAAYVPNSALTRMEMEWDWVVEEGKGTSDLYISMGSQPARKIASSTTSGPASVTLEWYGFVGDIIFFEIFLIDQDGDGGVQAANFRTRLYHEPYEQLSFIDVTALHDRIALDGVVSIREAMLAAATRRSYNEAPGGGRVTGITLPPGTIVFETAGQGEDNGLTGDLDVPPFADIRIAGALQGGSQLDLAGLDRAFDVAPSGKLALDGVEIINGAVLPAEPTKSKPADKIVGGVDAEPSEFPWLASIQYNGEHVCGGSLIAPSVVLSAGHCLDGLGPDAPLTVQFRPYDLSNPSEETITVGVQGFEIHREYFEPLVYRDVALIYLDRPVTEFEPIAIVAEDDPTSLTVPGTQAIVAGWGATSSGGAGSDVLQKVNVPVVPDELAADVYGPDFVPESMLPAGGVSGQDACQGDSGGPLFVNTGSDEEPSYVQIGVVSFGEGCGDEGVPGIYTRLSTTSDWIAETSDTLSSIGYAGGAIRNYGALTIANSVFRNNAALRGGAIMDYGALELFNSTISNNTAEHGAGIYSIGWSTITNSILWGNRDGDALKLQTDAPYRVRYSNVQGGVLPGEGNLSVSPQFVAPTDLSLKPASPMINVAEALPTLLDFADRNYDGALDGPNDLDFLGAYRIQGCQRDMGAYEFAQFPFKPGNDTDADGLNDCFELGGTDPRNPDSDADGFLDGVEVRTGTDPLNPDDPADRTDADQDGIPDSVDADPASADADGDRFHDGFEIGFGFDPNNPLSTPPFGRLDEVGGPSNVDATILMEWLRGEYPGTPDSIYFDVNRDGVVNEADAELIYQWSIGNVPLMPAPAP